MKTTQEIVLFSPVFCPTIGGRFNQSRHVTNPDQDVMEHNPVRKTTTDITFNEESTTRTDCLW